MAGAGVEDAGLVPELVRLPRAEASVSAAPSMQKSNTFQNFAARGLYFFVLFFVPIYSIQ